MKTEKEMYESTPPTPKTIEELNDYISECLKAPEKQKGDDDMGDAYGRCVYSMSLASVATFNYVASQLGVTGFQASCADMDIIRRTRNISGGFMLVMIEKLLYPQYNLTSDVQEFVNSEDTQKWLKEQAQILLEKNKDNEHVNPDVRNHWRKLVGEL